MTARTPIWIREVEDDGHRVTRDSGWYETETTSYRRLRSALTETLGTGRALPPGQRGWVFALPSGKYVEIEVHEGAPPGNEPRYEGHIGQGRRRRRAARLAKRR